MAETNLTHDQEMHVESHAPYIKVFLGAGRLHGDRILLRPRLQGRVHHPGAGPDVLAVIKASMVGWYFMHLKFEGRWVYYMLVPAGILALRPDLRPDARHRDAARRPTRTAEDERRLAPTGPRRPARRGARPAR